MRRGYGRRRSFRSYRPRRARVSRGRRQRIGWRM